jgi:hypothetical protein
VAQFVAVGRSEDSAVPKRRYDGLAVHNDRIALRIDREQQLLRGLHG